MALQNLLKSLEINFQNWKTTFCKKELRSYSYLIEFWEKYIKKMDKDIYDFKLIMFLPNDLIVYILNFKQCHFLPEYLM